MYEVEQKFRIASADAFHEKLASLGVRWRNRVFEIDTYLKHPARNFVETGEALRIRRQWVVDLVGEPCSATFCAFLTYKGPKLDVLTKTRRETELPLGDRIAFAPERLPLGETLFFEEGDLPTLPGADEWIETMKILGFVPVQPVKKVRMKTSWQHQGWNLEITFDRVAAAGVFAEIEAIAEALEDIGVAQDAVLDLAQSLGLNDVEPKSYLSLVMDKK
ncbi:MAG: class IV adenylate cyclase [Planctomycetia bacterium]|nr:class IV adenylate cyclase [Planctomycetia bacterium]